MYNAENTQANAAIIIETTKAGPAPVFGVAAAIPTTAKIPEPIRIPIPKTIKSIAVKVFFKPFLLATFIISSGFFLLNNLLRTLDKGLLFSWLLSIFFFRFNCV